MGRRRSPPGVAAVAGRGHGECAAARFRVPFDVGRRGYAVGAAVLEAVLPPHDGSTVTVPVSKTDEGLEERDGVEAKAIVVEHRPGPRCPPLQPGAECVPRRLQQILKGFPLIEGRRRRGNLRRRCDVCVGVRSVDRPVAARRESPA